ncbi:MAG TPA: glycosyltransferase family 39 protein [Chloroflexia bacterium]|nr:glycosyltransferase family 39 protein [Chloroflexia bacterium]
MDTLLPSIRTRPWLLMGAIFLLGLGLRIYCLDCYGYWGDEIASLDGGGLGLPGIFTQRFGWIGNQTPLHYMVVWLASQPADPTTTALWVRLPSALAGALTIPVVYGLGKELFGRAQGLLAALLLALSAVHLNYSQDVRSYTMLVLFSALSIYCLVRAERSGSGRWWAAFVAATALNVFANYHAMTLFLPSLAPYLAWLLWRLWRARAATPRPLLYALSSFLAVGAACAIMLLDMMNTPRPSPDLSRLSISSLPSSVVEMATWMTRFGIDARWERPLQLALFLLAVLGSFVAVRRGSEQRKSALLCLSMVVVPALILAVLSTRYVIFQRYALFAMPFYYLLISHALVPQAWGVRDEGRRTKDEAETPEQLTNPKTEIRNAKSYPTFRVPNIAFITAMFLVILLFLVGAYNYNSATGHESLSYRPGFRDAARDLSGRAQPQDIIIFIDDPALGYTISGFYWRGLPPAQVFDARDPLLYTHNLQGDIYWVVSADDPRWLPALATPGHGWADVLRFEGVTVLREAHPTTAIIERVERIVGEMEALSPNYQPVKTLRGTLFQARGDIDNAVSAYRSAGAYFPTGDEYLRTARGFAALGDDWRAWREALLSKFWQPDNPSVHRWLSGELLKAGRDAESRVEAEIAEALGRTKDDRR